MKPKTELLSAIKQNDADRRWLKSLEEEAVAIRRRATVASERFDIDPNAETLAELLAAKSDLPRATTLMEAGVAASARVERRCSERVRLFIPDVLKARIEEVRKWPPSPEQIGLLGRLEGWAANRMSWQMEWAAILGTCLDK